jgi:hypothetical protein
MIIDTCGWKKLEVIKLILQIGTAVNIWLIIEQPFHINSITRAHLALG